MSRAETDKAQGRRQTIAVAALLFLAACLVFGRTLRHEFVSFDDNSYVRENPRVAAGLTAGGIGWAFTQRHSANWHPLTWISHMLDVELYGLRPGGHHLTSVLLHAATAVLLLLALHSMTGRLWASAFAAALFALHPLRVESVAWVAERKDVLSGLFFALTLGAYVRYARRPRATARYWAVLTLFALGLMAKPMLVTLPALLLLLDFWPLGRTRRFSFPAPLLREKLPLLALAAASAGVTYWAQHQALIRSEWLPYPWRLANALVAYLAYLGKFSHPLGLAVFYPHPHIVPTWKIATATLALLGATAGAWALRRTHPHLLLGWLWYLGMLVPVIGVVQVGGQAMADRYTYLPQIGLGLAMAAAAVAARRAPALQRLLPAAACLCLTLLASLAWRQAGLWRDNLTLFTHAIAHTSGNQVAHNNLGVSLAAEGRLEEANSHLREALAINPDYADAHANLGAVLATQGRLDEAIAHFRTALELEPDYSEAYSNLGNSLASLGRIDEAIASFRKLLAIKPGDAEAHGYLADALARGGRFEEAIAEYRKALEIAPGFASARNNLGRALASLKRSDEAIAEYRKALEIRPDLVSAQNNLGAALADRGRYDEAVEHYRSALAIQPAHAEAHNNLGNALAALKRTDEALAQYQLALASNPRYAEARYNIGNTLASRGRMEEAIEQYRAALAIDAGHTNARTNLGNALAGVGRLEEAIEQFRTVLESKPDHIIACTNLGNALAAQGRLEESAAQYRRALKIQPNFAEGHLRLGKTLAALGQPDEARSHFRSALDLALGQGRQALAEDAQRRLALLAAGRTIRP